MEIPRNVLIIVIGAAAIAVFVYFNLTGGGTGPGKYDEFAKCLTSSGVKMYGAFWCPHCENQKKMFGSSWGYVDYVECSLPDKSGQTQVCIQAGIKLYPTWQFHGGERVEGELTFGELGEKSGCELG